MRKTVFVCLALAAYLTFSGTAFAEGDPAKGKALYAVCLACHGPDGGGNKALGAPRISHLPAWYAGRQLANFKTGSRGTDPKDTFGAQMRPMAMTLVDEQAIKDVLAYIATLESAAPAATIEGDAAAGKGLYATCTACHGANGEGNKALNAPSLAGQQDTYLVRQLMAYKAGIRGADPKDMFGSQMRPMAMMLADEAAVRNVVAYINTLK